MTDLLKPTQLHDYQKECVLHQLYNNDSMLWLQMGLGKEQPDSEPVLTPTGWVSMGSLRVGDHVIGSNGKPTRIHGVYPQGVKPVVQITFSDGSTTRCGWDHLWQVSTNYRRWANLPGKTMTTRQILDEGVSNSSGLKWSIPLVEPVEYAPAAALPVDAYTLGVILGDGNVSEKSGVTVCTDLTIIDAIGCSTVKPHETSQYTGYGYIPGVKQIMRDLDLMGKRSWEKHIPEIYLRASVADRLALLQGLLDTDGSPIAGGGIEFSSTSEALLDAVVELTQSLGGVARNKVDRITWHQNGEGRRSWRVNVKLPGAMTPFRLQRKLDRWIRPTKYQPLRNIKSIVEVGEESSRCISVDAEDRLYVTKDYIVTHNTPITLTTIVDRMRAGQVQKTLILGPLRVIQAVWAREARKWEHTKHLRFSVIHGVKEKRLRAMFADADIFLCNYENLNWLADQLMHYYISQGKPLPWQMCVYDEVSKMKNSTTKRMAGGKRDRKDRWGTTHEVKFTGWRKIIPHFQYRTGLTGTPASNGYLDLHGQYLAVDGGKRLGEYVTGFKDQYFASDYNGWKYTPTDVGKQWIEYQISDITKKMDACDYLDMPAVKTIDMLVDLPPAARKAYIEMEKEMFSALDSGVELEVFSKASISNKVLQIANGSPYFGETKEYEALHDAKLDALESILEEAGGSPVLCSYSFKADVERIMKRFKKYQPVNLTATRSQDTEKVIDKWNSGGVKLLVGHPASVGHGVDGLQQSGSILVWFGVNWSLELYEQMCGRLARQGQKHPVSIIRILCRDTVDIAVADAINRKADDQEGLKKALERYRDGITTNELEVNFF